MDKDAEIKKKEKKDFDRAVGNRVRNIREQAELTQEKFSEILDVRPQFVSRVERGQSGLSNMLAVKMSKRFCETCDYILRGVETENDISPIVEKLKRLSPEELAYVERGIMKDIELIAFEKSRRAEKESGQKQTDETKE